MAKPIIHNNGFGVTFHTNAGKRTRFYLKGKNFAATTVVVVGSQTLAATDWTLISANIIFVDFQYAPPVPPIKTSNEVDITITVYDSGSPTVTTDLPVTVYVDGTP